MTIDENLLVLLLALLLDRIVGDPDWLWSRLPHPVVLFGKAISNFDRQFNSETLTKAERRLNGTVSITVLLAFSAAAGLVLHWFFGLFGFVGILLEIACVAIFLAQKSLADHVSAVAEALRGEGIVGGRKAISRIVGRDPETLDEPGICRAAIESLAENFSDGVVAPALWYVVLGLPGLFLYKMLEYRRLDDRTQVGQVHRFRLGLGSPRRSGELAGRPSCHPADRRWRLASARRKRQPRGLPGCDPRRRSASLPEFRPAGSGHGRCT